MHWNKKPERFKSCFGKSRSYTPKIQGDIVPEEIKDEDIEVMNKDINRWMAKIRIWFYSRYYSDAGKLESRKGFG